MLNIHLRLIALVGLLFLTQIISAAMRVTDITGRTVVIHASSRVIALGSTLTEIVHPLGAQERLVGVDATSTWPLATGTPAKVGALSKLSAKRILSLRPSLILATEDAARPRR